MKVNRLILAGAISLAVAGCGRREPLVSNPELTVTDIKALPTPTMADLTPDQRPYGLGPGDKLIVTVFGLDNLGGKFQVDAGGRVALPLAGSFLAAGKTPAALSDEIEAALRKHFVRDPQVSINLEETQSQLVTVDGEVREPGNYAIGPNMTLVRAVAAAKGPSEFAKLEDVVIFRTVDGRRYAALYNLGAIRRGIYGDPPIYANDIVQVGDSPGRRLFRTLIQASGLITTPLIVALQRR